MGLLREFWGFAKEHKKYWLLPIILFLVLISLLIISTGTSAVAPFIYTLF